jgi:hypothetical protein
MRASQLQEREREREIFAGEAREIFAGEEREILAGEREREIFV